ncbi:MAG TPA: histidine kinase, partial [Terriglobales bacterium]|nr:histidine kinase [Terriglobales bacterium]
MQRKYSASLWLPLIVAIVSLTATLVVFRALRNQERFQVERVVKLATYSIEADMVADMNLRIRGLADLARLWSISPIPKREEFDLRGTLYMSQVPGCIAVGWVDSSLSSDWSLPVGGDSIARQVVSGADEKTRMRLQSLAESRESLVGHSLILAHEERVLPVWTPVFAGKQFRGFLLGVFRVQPLLEDILSDHADLGYEVQVAEDKDPIFKLTSAIPENRWAQEARVPLPGVDWHLRIWPGPKALPEMLPLSQVVLLGGLIMCIQLTLTVYLALRERSAALYADQINRELTAENNERRRAEESLHVLSSRLLTLQDEERRHLARELHDSTAQILYGLVIKLKLLSQTVATESAVVHDSIYESIELADQCQRDLRTMSYLLHPPSLDDLGLAPALRTLVNGFSERSGIQAVLDTPENLR